MRDKKSSETNNFIIEKIETNTNSKKCSSCNNILPLILDNRICPNCKKRTG